jgi:hypothetical protein
MPKARAQVAIFKDTGRDWVPEHFTRSPWAVIRATQRQLYQQAWSGRNSTFSYVDINNTSHTVNTATSGTLYNANSTAGVNTMRWGTNNTPATDTDRDMQTFQDTMNATSAYDTTNMLATFQGSKLYTGPTTTMREIGHAITFFNNSGAIQTFLLDRAVVADTPVTNNRTVAIEYFWTF